MRYFFLENCKITILGWTRKIILRLKKYVGNIKIFLCNKLTSKKLFEPTQRLTVLKMLAKTFRFAFSLTNSRRLRCPGLQLRKRWGCETERFGELAQFSSRNLSYNTTLSARNSLFEIFRKVKELARNFPSIVFKWNKIETTGFLPLWYMSKYVFKKTSLINRNEPNISTCQILNKVFRSILCR